MHKICLWTAAILQLAIPAWAQIDPAAKKIAYVTVLEDARAELRIAPVKAEVDRLWQARTRDKPAMQWRTFRYQLPAPAPKDRKLTAAEETKRSEQAQRNTDSLAALAEWKPDVVYAPGAAAADAVEKSIGAPIVVGCKCYPKGSWKLTEDLQKPTRRITGFSRYFLEEKDVPPSAIVGTAEDRSRGAAFSSLHAKRLEYLRMVLGKRDGEWMAVLVLYGEQFNRERWDYPKMAATKQAEWVEVFMEQKDIPNLKEIFESKRVESGPLAGRKFEAGLVLADTFLDNNTEDLAKAAGEVSVPIMFPWDEAQHGAWMHFGTKVDVAGKAARYIVDMLVDVAGGKRTISEYPIDGPKEMELGVNRAVFARWKRAIPQDLVDDPGYQPYPRAR